jgi:hypothetical protein
VESRARRPADAALRSSQSSLTCRRRTRLAAGRPHGRPSSAERAGKRARTRSPRCRWVKSTPPPEHDLPALWILEISAPTNSSPSLKAALDRIAVLQSVGLERTHAPPRRLTKTRRGDGKATRVPGCGSRRRPWCRCSNRLQPRKGRREGDARAGPSSAPSFPIDGAPTTGWMPCAVRSAGAHLAW